MNLHTKFLTTFATNSSQHLLHYSSVNTIWRELSSTNTYRDTHHTAMPSVWFQQTRALNISTAMARHLTKARNRLKSNDKQIKNDIHGALYPFTKARHHNFQISTCIIALYSPILQKPRSHQKV